MYFIIILIIILCTVVILRLKQQQIDEFREWKDAQPVENTGKRTYTDDGGSYLIEYPADWDVEDHSFKNEMIRADINRDEIVGFQIRLLENPGIPEQDYTGRYLTTFAEEMRTHWQGRVEIISAMKNIGEGFHHWQGSLSLIRADDSKWFLKEYIWFNNDRILVFQSGTPWKYRELYEPILDEVAASVEFTR